MRPLNIRLMAQYICLHGHMYLPIYDVCIRHTVYFLSNGIQKPSDG